jgi:type IV secretion system protein TrbE
MQGLSLAVGGRHYVLGDSGAAIAPLKAAASDQLGFGWAQEWLEQLVTLSGVDLTPLRRRKITSALRACIVMEGEALSAFHAMVQNDDIKHAVAPFIAGGAFAGILNGEHDEIALSRFTVFETEELFETGEAAGLLTIDYLFRRIERRLGGAPTLILLDEAWSYLGHDVFRARIKKWLRELRKSNASVVIATQFIGDALDSELAGALLQSCRTRIFLPDGEAKASNISENYRRLGLSDAQIDLIATMKPKRDYYVVKPEGRRVVDFAIQPKALALLGATNTEDSTRAAQMAAADPDGWWRDFIEFRLRRMQNARSDD